MAHALKSKVAAGQYATESEVIREGLRALASRDEAAERWLEGAVASTYDRLLANPEQRLSADSVRQRLDALHRQHAARTAESQAVRT